jgi:ATP diphosphatase
VHFDWPSVDGPLDKVAEELAEVRETLSAQPPALAPSGAPAGGPAHERLAEELGDLLFSCVNLCRKAGVHAATALDRANEKFARRFQAVERLARERGLVIGQVPLEVLDALWDDVKASERSQPDTTPAAIP